MGKRSGWKITSLITKFWPKPLDLDKLAKLYGDLPIDEIHILQHWPQTTDTNYVEAYRRTETLIDLSTLYFGPNMGVSNGRVHLEALERKAPIEGRSSRADHLS